ncbi:hypothetical protein ARMSODRAFT_948409 [Armillaria solidipes]|uniref:DUF1793-domain-containing protein n=1 Tax=Armillaria solidipes TaxID=1076256 RepID=A0A2H3CMR4_9AGAR|nr:hypothetical protein ARMSODRAFT_948409 [Armillaria solidipes]
MLLSALFLIICFTCPTLVCSAFFPAALPLAVRSPYFQCYADTRAGNDPNNQWPQYWTESRILGWSGWIRIDETTFQLWGDSGTATNLTGFEVTPTRTIFSIHANTTNVNVTFLSPIEPSDLVLQSLPFSYVYIDVESNDGQEHSIQLYSDISAEWISGDSASLAEWSTTKTDSSAIHKAARQSPLSMQEISNLAEDATVYYAFPLSNDATYETGADTVVRGDFSTRGALLNTADVKFRAISDHFVVLGHAVNLNNITSTTSSVVWAIGLVRDPVISLYSTSANNSRSSYFWTAYNTVSDAVDFFLSDFSNAKQRAINLDNKITSDARQISDNYADLVTLAARQALAVDITVSKDNEGQWNTSDVMTFMRDVGNSRRVNPVEMLYAAFPAYLYFNTTWSPGQGAMFSLMALRLQNQTVSGGNGSSSNTNHDQSSSSSSNAGAIAGGVVGGLAVLAVLVFGFFMIRRRQRRKHDMYHQPSGWSSSSSDTPFFMGVFGKRRSPKRENDSSDPVLSEPVIPQPYDLYGSYGSQHPLQPLRPGQQYASVEPHPQRKGGQPIILSSTTTGPTAIASTTAYGSSSASRSGGSDSDNTTTLQLQSEVENLRREMDEMRARGLYEPPPQYT